MLSKTKRPWLPILALLMIFLLGVQIAGAVFGDPEPKEVEFSKVMDEIQAKDAKKKIEKVTLFKEDARVLVEYEDEDKQSIYTYIPLEYGETFIERTEKSDLKVEVKGVPGSFLLTLNSLFPLILLALLLWFVLAGGMGGSLGGRNKSKAISEIPDVRFTDIAGANEAVEDLQEIVDFLKDPAKFEAMGAKSPKGALLSGPPGTGKTLLARAVAGEAGVPFYATSGSDFQTMWVGSGAGRIRRLFETARKNGPSIVFIDEIDAVGGKRSDSTRGVDQEHNRTINTLLTEMDGFEKSNVIVLAATNAPEKLDSALVRPGRIDRKIVVDLPDWKGRLGILDVHMKGKSIGASVTKEILAKSTAGLAGADIANLINEALINAARSGRKEAEQEDFMEALSIVTIGRARKSRVMTDEDKRVIATHEAGHAIVGMALDEIPDPTHISITPRGFSGGHTKLQEPDNVFQTSKQMKARMAMMLGGLVAERTLLGDITQGPGHDLQAATETATRMVAAMGMGSNLTVVDSQTIAVNGPIGNEVRSQVEHLIQEALSRAEAVFADAAWRNIFEKMVSELLAVETLETEDIQRLKGQANAGETSS